MQFATVFCVLEEDNWWTNQKSSCWDELCARAVCQVSAGWSGADGSMDERACRGVSAIFNVLAWLQEAHALPINPKPSSCSSLFFLWPFVLFIVPLVAWHVHAYSARTHALYSFPDENCTSYEGKAAATAATDGGVSIGWNVWLCPYWLLIFSLHILPGDRIYNLDAMQYAYNQIGFVAWCRLF